MHGSAVPRISSGRNPLWDYLTMRKQRIVGTRNGWPWYARTAARIQVHQVRDAEGQEGQHHQQDAEAVGGDCEEDADDEDRYRLDEGGNPHVERLRRVEPDVPGFVHLHQVDHQWRDDARASAPRDRS
jgi:hypothetical protein